MKPVNAYGVAKSTTMRMILRRDASTGTETVGGKPHRKHARPLQVVGALLEAPAVRTSRSAYHHLLVFAATHGITNSRVADVIEMVGLQDVAHQTGGRILARHGTAPRDRSAHRRACHHVVGRGRLTADMPMSELIAQAFSSAVVVRSPQAGALADALVVAARQPSMAAAAEQSNAPQRIAQANSATPAALAIPGLAGVPYWD